MAIVNLSKWDFAIEFMLYEAAALIVGLEPAEIYTSTKPDRDNDRIYDYHEHPQIKPVVDRMKLDYFAASELYAAMRKGKWPYSSDEPLSESVLRTREMEIVPLKIGSWCLPLDPATQAIFDNLELDGGVYETVKFTRSELSRWLSANCLNSVYQFGHRQPDAHPASTTRWPWGNHHTELLGHLEAAASEFWLSYNPENARATAPKNKTVIAWLVARRIPGQKKEISSQMANAIASMLRPDDLPTGPRKIIVRPPQTQ